MKVIEKTKNFYSKHRKTVNLTSGLVLAALFVGSICLSIFSGGELLHMNDGSSSSDVKGVMKLTSASYNTSYITGDSFVFDKDSAVIQLLVKDPSLDSVVDIENLPPEDYGFMINGEGEFYEDASSVIMGQGIDSVYVVSKDYQTVGVEIPVTVYKSIDTSLLIDDYLMEAEDADLYDAAGNLLTDEQKATEPNDNKPYRSDEGQTPAGEDCSGGACLRNLTVGMYTAFDFVSSTSGTVTMNLGICERPKAVTLDNVDSIDVNGKLITTGATIPASSDGGYFTNYVVHDISISVVRGFNKVVITDKNSSEGIPNLDYVEFKASEATIGPKNALEEYDPDSKANAVTLPRKVFINALPKEGK